MRLCCQSLPKNFENICWPTEGHVWAISGPIASAGVGPQRVIAITDNIYKLDQADCCCCCVGVGVWNLRVVRIFVYVLEHQVREQQVEQ